MRDYKLLRIDLIVKFNGRPPSGEVVEVEREDGAICRFRDGKLHSEGWPAVIKPCGTEEWYRDGKLHRDEGPAIIMPGGSELWYRNGKLHRDDGPAITRLCQNGSLMREWYQDGVRHRDGAPAMMGRNYEAWYQNGKLHRENGPAYRSDDATGWFLRGAQHREDGPAWIEGKYPPVWYLHGVRVDPPQNRTLVNAELS